MPFLFDKIILALLIIFFVIGWFKGFLRALIGPISFFICAFFAVLFYDLNRNILASSLITILGTLALATLFSTLLTIGAATVNKDFRGKIFLGSRVCGSTLNLLWNGNALFIALLIVMLLPAAEGSKLEKLQDLSKDSAMVKYYYQHFFSKELRAKAVFVTLANLYDPDVRDRISKMHQFQDFQNGTKVQELLNDPNVIDGIQTKNIWKITTSPRFGALIADDRAMASFTIVARTLYRENLHALGYVPPPDPEDKY